MADKIYTSPVSIDELMELVEELVAIRGRHTELVSVLVPGGSNLNIVIDQLESEKSTARNIKSAATRKNVIEALEKAMRVLRMLNQKTPKNGIAVYAGNVSEVEGQQDMRTWAIIPPEELNMRLYRCDQVFIVEALKEMLEVKELYGLFVIERKEATIGLLEGKRIKVLQKIESGVPGKVRAGGQCLSLDSMIMKDNGEIVEIKDSHNPLLLVSENFNKEETENTPVIQKWENNKELFRVSTKFPKFEIKSSPDHTFFVRTEEGIQEKPLLEISEGDFLLIPEKISLSLQEQEIHFKPVIRESWNMKKVFLPSKLDEPLAKIMGYYLGDGNWEVDRISFSEQRKEVVEYYKNVIDKYFGVNSSLRFRENKGYYQLKVGSRLISQFFKFLFPCEDKTLNQGIPSLVLRSPDYILACFINGIFDAEGYVSKGRIALGVNNKLLVRQLQFILLRLGIVSSINEYNNRKNPYSKKIRYTLAIDDLESLKKFYSKIGLSSKEKQEKLWNIINNRGNRNKVRQIAVCGKDIARILRNSGLTTTQFRCPDFFVNKKQLSKEVFKKNIIDKIANGELKRRLEFIYNSNLIVAKIDKIDSIGIADTIDIETKNHNFIANGIIVHNSSQRFERITEGKAKDFYRECAELLKKHFFNMKNLKGILIGGPMPTKDEFLKEGLLATALKDKIIGMKDIGYADEHGLELLVESSRDLLAQQEITKEQILMERFFEMLGKERKKTAYGLEDVEKALELASVDTLLLSKKLDKKIAGELKKKAEDTSANVELVSVDTEEGRQFFNLGGIGAILRFSLN